MTDTNVYSITFKPIYDSVSRLFEQNRIDQGLHYLDSATRHISQLTVADKFRIYGFHYVANNKIKHDNKTALLYADSMLSVLEKQPNRQSYLPYYAEASFAKGDALFELGKYTDAFNSYYQGYLTGKNDFNNCTLSDYTYRMGMITYKQGNFKSSASYFKESFDQCASCKEEFTTFFRQQEVLDNIALCYRNYGQLDSSVDYINKA